MRMEMRNGKEVKKRKARRVIEDKTMTKETLPVVRHARAHYTCGSDRRHISTPLLRTGPFL